MYQTVPINEYNTSQMCNNCHLRLRSVKINGKILRGLKYCDNEECKLKYVNRDYNAALNIMQCYQSRDNRPVCFTPHHNQNASKGPYQGTLQSTLRV